MNKLKDIINPALCCVSLRRLLGGRIYYSTLIFLLYLVL